MTPGYTPIWEVIDSSLSGISSTEKGYDVAGLGDANVDARAVVEQQKATLLINGIPFDVAAAAPFDVRGTFGDESMLVNCYSGQALDTNEWGITVQSLQPGAVYYLVRSSRWYFI